MNIYEFDPDDAKRFGQEQHIKYQQRGDELQFKYCPYCRNKTDDKNTFAINLRTGQFKCLRASCGAKGNMITLARDFNFLLEMISMSISTVGRNIEICRGIRVRS